MDYEKTINKIFLTFLVTFILAFFLGMSVASATIKIAVIDTGFDFNYPRHVKLCQAGHKDFTNTTVQDFNGHGTHISGLIADYSGNVDYCIVILKYYLFGATGKENLRRSIEALEYALYQNVNVINYSGGGNGVSDKECGLVKLALDKGIHLVMAAGNEYSDLYREPYYPAMCDSRIIVVGSVDITGKRVVSSNYGKAVDFTEMGLEVKSILPYNKTGHLTGTSQATAIRTGKLVKELYNCKKIIQFYNCETLISLRKNLAPRLQYNK